MFYSASLKRLDSKYAHVFRQEIEGKVKKKRVILGRFLSFLKKIQVLVGENRVAQAYSKKEKKI